jgi:hypothetical protein
VSRPLTPGDVPVYSQAHLDAAVARAAATERERIIQLASRLRAAFPADQPPGAMASFADYLRVTGQP